MEQEQILYEAQGIRLAYGCFENPDRTRQKAHRHLHCELLYLYRSCGRFHVDGNTYKISDGDLIVIRPGELHYMELDPNAPYDRLVLRFSPDLFDSMDPERVFLQPFFDRPSGKRNHYTVNLQPKLGWAGFFRSMQQNPVRSNILMNLVNLLYQMHVCYAKQLPDTSSDTLEYRITQYINRNLQEDLSCQSLCRKFFISRTQLHHRFLKATNTTVGKYIATQRMLYAQQLISQGHKPTDIYAKCGFRDYSSFYRAYLRHWGEKPSQKSFSQTTTIIYD